MEALLLVATERAAVVRRGRYRLYYFSKMTSASLSRLYRIVEASRNMGSGIYIWK